MWTKSDKVLSLRRAAPSARLQRPPQAAHSSQQLQQLDNSEQLSVTEQVDAPGPALDQRPGRTRGLDPEARTREDPENCPRDLKQRPGPETRTRTRDQGPETRTQTTDDQKSVPVWTRHQDQRHRPGRTRDQDQAQRRGPLWFWMQMQNSKCRIHPNNLTDVIHVSAAEKI